MNPKEKIQSDLNFFKNVYRKLSVLSDKEDILHSAGDVEILYMVESSKVQKVRNSLKVLDKEILAKLEGDTRIKFKNLDLENSSICSAENFSSGYIMYCYVPEEAMTILKDQIIKNELSSKSEIDLQYRKLLLARENNMDFEEGLAKMICGNDGIFPARTFSDIKKIFQRSCNFDFEFIYGEEDFITVVQRLRKLDIKEIYQLIGGKYGIFEKEHFWKAASGDSEKFNDIYSAAKEKFRKLVRKSIRFEEGVDLSDLLDISINAELLYENIPKSDDKRLNDLIEEARELFRSSSCENKQTALEKLWDAFERLKTHNSSRDKKKESAIKIVDSISNEEDFNIFENEFKQLTDIGNNYAIRHHERGIPIITDPRKISYFFFRLLALIDLCLGVIYKEDSEKSEKKGTNNLILKEIL